MSISYVESAVIGLLQGVTELFPVSSLGHAILVPALVGGKWSRDLSVTNDPAYLSFIVGLHVATAVALIIFFRRDWVRIVGGLIEVARTRQVVGPDQRLAVLLVLATIPVGLVGLALDKTVRTEFAKTTPTSIFLMINGVVLLVGEYLRRRQLAADPGSADVDDPHEGGVEADARLASMSTKRAVLVGAAQIAALFPGISRSGSVLIAGMLPGGGRLNHGDAARFSFLLATPVILAAGLLKLPKLAGSEGSQIGGGQLLLGSLLAGVGAYVSVAFLTRFFRSNSATPFGFYCLVGGAVSLAVVLAR